VSDLFRWILDLCGVVTPPKEPTRPWLIDREGTVYKPERKVVLKAKAPAQPVEEK
jgi:hypothetical protein